MVSAKYMGFKHFIFKNWSKVIGVSFQMIAFLVQFFYCIRPNVLL